MPYRPRRQYEPPKNIFQKIWDYRAVPILIVLFLVLVIYNPVHAETIVLGQGDTAYTGETVDLSLVVAWPDYVLAYCQNGYAGCHDPQTFDFAETNQHRVYLDAKKYPIGVYFRYEGKWNSAENSYAMTILPGPRPLNKTIFTSQPASAAWSQTYTPKAKLIRNNTNVLIARGDAGDFVYQPNFTGYQPAYLWMFAQSPSATSGMVLGEPMGYRSNDSAYLYNFTDSFTQNLTEGVYNGYIQFTGQNKIQDVFYNPERRVKMSSPIKCLDTPYDHELIPAVDIAGLTPSLVQNEFERLEKTKYADDLLIPINVTIATPYIAMTDYYESWDGEFLTVAGKTTAAAGTDVTVKLDPNNYKLKEDINLHTWHSTATGDISSIRVFNVTFPVNWEEMAIGNHTVRASIDGRLFHSDASHDFKVSSVWVMPTPTPQMNKVVVEQYGWHQVGPVPVNTPMPTRTPCIVYDPNDTSLCDMNAPELTQTPVPPLGHENITGSNSNETSSNLTGGSYVTVDYNNTAEPVTGPTPTAIPTIPTPVPTMAVNVPVPWWITVAAAGIAVLSRRK